MERQEERKTMVSSQNGRQERIGRQRTEGRKGWQKDGAREEKWETAGRMGWRAAVTRGTGWTRETDWRNAWRKLQTMERREETARQ